MVLKYFEQEHHSAKAIKLKNFKYKRSDKRRYRYIDGLTEQNQQAIRKNFIDFKKKSENKQSVQKSL